MGKREIYIISILLVISLVNANPCEDITIETNSPELNCNVPFNLNIVDKNDLCDVEVNCWKEYQEGKLALDNGLTSPDKKSKELGKSQNNWGWRVICSSPSIYQATITLTGPNASCTESIRLDLTNNTKYEEPVKEEQKTVIEEKTPEAVEQEEVQEETQEQLPNILEQKTSSGSGTSNSLTNENQSVTQESTTNPTFLMGIVIIIAIAALAFILKKK